MTENVRWFQIRSWHVYSGFVSRGGLLKAVCGRWSGSNTELVDDRPVGKTCESCLRIAGPK